MMSSHLLPSFVILGAQKSGSTWLHLNLRAHPDIYMPREEVPFFEDPDYGSGDLSRLAALFPPRAKGKKIGIKRPSYLSQIACAPRIARAVPRAKLIIVLRKPVDRAISAVYHLMNHGLLAIGDPNSILRGLLAGEPYPTYVKRLVLDAGLYGRGIAAYRGYFPDEQIIIALHKTVEQNGREDYAKICSLLGVRGEFIPKSIDVARNEGCYSLALLRLLSTLNGSLYNYDLDIGRLYRRNDSSANAARLVSFLARRIHARIKGAGNRPRITDDVCRRLIEYYEADTATLERITSLDFSDWRSLDREARAGFVPSTTLRALIESRQRLQAPAAQARFRRAAGMGARNRGSGHRTGLRVPGGKS